MRVLSVNRLLPVMYFLIAGRCCAQTISFSNVPRINQRGGYNRVIGEHADGLYLLRLRNAEGRGMVSLEHYSHNLSFQQEKTYRLGQERLVKAHLLEHHCLLFTGLGDRNRGVFALNCKKLNNKLEEVNQKNRLLEFDRYDFYKDQVLGTSDRSGHHLLFYADSRDGQGRQVLDVALMDTAFQPLFRSQKTLEIQADAFRILDLETDIPGNVYVLASEQQKDKRKNDPASSHVVLYFFERNAQAWIRHDLSRGLFFLNSARLCYNDSLKSMVIAGFYSDAGTDGAAGVFMASIQPEQPGAVRYDQAAFSGDFIAGIVGANQADALGYLSNFRIRKLLPRSDGGLVVVAERYYVTQRVETTYISGISQTNTTNYYHHDEVIVLSLAASGRFEWQEVVRKRQSALLSASQFSGIGICATPNGVMVVYNESGNGNVMQVLFHKDGNREQQILLRSETSFTALLPSEGAQTGYNRMVLPCMRNRQISLLKLTY